jgi:hypothetical protein
LGFVGDLKKGKDAELIVLELLNSSNIYSYIDKGAKEKWDIVGEYNNKEFTIEVKLDEREKKSGNIALEVFNCKANKDSGISSSQADIWIYVLSTGEIWATNTALLREYIKNNTPKRSIKGAGDGNATIYLYECYQILSDIFFRIDNMDEKSIQGFMYRHGIKNDKKKNV